jgi:hypothetical protein
MMPTEHISPLTAPPGGVWTDDVGVITGALELRTTCSDDGSVQVSVRYEEADEWYAVRGGACRLHDPADAEVLHTVLHDVLHRPEG